MNVSNRLFILILIVSALFTPTQIEAVLPALIQMPAATPSRAIKPPDTYLVPAPSDFFSKQEKEKELKEAFRQQIVREKRLYRNITKYVDGPQKGTSHVDELISEFRGILLVKGTIILNAETYYLCTDDGTLYHQLTTTIKERPWVKLTIPKGALLLQTSEFGLAIALPGGLRRAIEAINGFLTALRNQEHMHWNDLYETRYQMLTLCETFIKDGLFTDEGCGKLAVGVWDHSCDDDMSAINALDYLVNVLALLKEYTNFFVKNEEKTTKIQAIDSVLFLVQQTKLKIDQSSLKALKGEALTPTGSPKTGSPKTTAASTAKLTASVPPSRRKLPINRRPLPLPIDYKTAALPTSIPLPPTASSAASALLK